MNDPNCIFCKIASGELKSKTVYEDEHMLAFHDIHPQAPIHILVIPKLHIATLAECDERHVDVLGRMMAAVPRIAREQGASEGFRVIVNNGRVAGQEVYHLHIHIVGGPTPLPPMLRRN